jgi:hypothetical protein
VCPSAPTKTKPIHAAEDIGMRRRSTHNLITSQEIKIIRPLLLVFW